MFLILLSIIKNYLCVTRRLSAKDKQESKRYISSKNEALEQNVSCLKATLVYKLQMYVCIRYVHSFGDYDILEIILTVNFG